MLCLAKNICRGFKIILFFKEICLIIVTKREGNVMKLQGVTAFNTQLNPYLKQERTGSPHVQFVKHDTAFGITGLDTFIIKTVSRTLEFLCLDDLDDPQKIIRQMQKFLNKSVVAKRNRTSMMQLTSDFTKAILSLLDDIDHTAQKGISLKTIEDKLQRLNLLIKPDLRYKKLSVDGEYYYPGYPDEFSIYIRSKNDGFMLKKIFISFEKVSLDTVKTILDFIGDTNGAMTDLINRGGPRGTTKFKSIDELKNHIKSFDKSKKYQPWPEL